MNDKQPDAMPEKKEDDLVEMLRVVVIALCLAMVLRTFLFEPFNIPSESMYPTLEVGDYLFVEKYAYGYSQYSFPLNLIRFRGRVMEDMPRRGDVAVFRLPTQPHIDYIKRIIGLPGDRIQVRHGVLFINDAPVTREYTGTEKANVGGHEMIYKKYRETLPNGVGYHIYEVSDYGDLDNTPVYEVPAGHYFAMGDNRDNSQDSRVLQAVGYVPAENLVGRAAVLFYSRDARSADCTRTGHLATLREWGCYLVSWPQSVRYERMFSRVRNL